MKPIYIHKEDVHNLQSPREIVPLLIKLFSPKSVVDIGCGLGTFLHEFYKNGVDDYLGIDGQWVDKDKLSKYINLDNFKIMNFDENITLNKKYDLALCLEVIEHINEKYADRMVRNLSNISDVIVFSAAIPFQGGQNHINEQWLDYWQKKFNDNNYSLFDIIRPMIWNNTNVFYWYKQNIVVFINNDRKDIRESLGKKKVSPILNIVHPECFISKINEYKELSDNYYVIVNGRSTYKAYLKMILSHTKHLLKNNKHQLV